MASAKISDCCLSSKASSCAGSISSGHVNSSGSGLRIFLIASILLFLAIVNIHVDALARAGSKSCALFQTVAIAS